MKVVGYARTSYAEQVDGSFSSVEEQERDLRQFAERTGLALEAVHKDTGLNPNHGTCAGLISILDSMENGWEAVLVSSACRLRGAPNVSFDPLVELRENDKRVLIADPSTADALAKIVARVKASRKAAEPEPEPQCEGVRRRKIAERLLKGREAGAKAGKHQSGPAPFGYRRDYSRRTTDGVLLVPDEKESEIVQLIFREYLRLRSMKRLIKLLDDMGLKTRRGKRWSRAGVSWILKNDTYVGRVHFGDIRAKGRHESIVSAIVFNRVQKLIQANNKRNRKDDTAKAPAKRARAKSARTQAAPAKATAGKGRTRKAQPAPAHTAGGEALREREPASVAS